MKPGELAMITVPVPSLFESIGSEPTQVMKRGDLVVLLRCEPTKWHWPCWQVLYNDQIGVVASRWLASVQKYDDDVYLDVDIEDSNQP